MAQCISPVILNRGALVVPCSKCNFCLSNRRADWSFRLEQELHDAASAKFITLTYDAENVPIELDEKGNAYYALSKAHLMQFHKQIKQFQARLITKQKRKGKWSTEFTNNYKKKWRIRYLSVGEYGSNTDRPHYHSIMFNALPETWNALADGKIWGRGFVKFGETTTKSINYVCKYVVDREPDMIWGRIKPFSFMSKNPGLGAGYLGRAKKWHRNKPGQREAYRFYTLKGKFKARLPRYYKDRMFTTVERQIAGIEAEMQAFARQEDELLQLATLNYPDPEREYEHRRQFKHAMIRVKSKQLNTF